MFPAERIVVAAKRWLRLLRGSTIGQAWSIILSDSNYTDLTQTQYAVGLDWLKVLTLVVDGGNGLELPVQLRQLHEEQISQVLFERAVEKASPAWLPDVDVLVRDAAELPQDALSLAETLGLNESVAYTAVTHVHGRLDLEERKRVGLAGERELVHLLEQHWPGSTSHVSQSDDGFGYDVLFRHNNAQWHLEVKSTTRRGRLVIHVSRHEHDVGLLDPSWRLVVVGLDEDLRLKAVATVRYSEVVGRAPRDVRYDAKWQSVSFELTQRDLERGVTFANRLCLDANAVTSVPTSGIHSPVATFEWMPPQN